MSRLIDNDPCLVKARDDEPAFIILGRDPAAVVAMEAWLDERHRLIENGLLPNTDEEHQHLEAVATKIIEMRNYWPKSFGRRNAK